MSYRDEWFKGRRDATRRSADAIAPFVSDLVRPTSVVDLGCGTGSWLAAFELKDIRGVDGPWVNRELLEIPQEKFMAHDLNLPLPVSRAFDLAISVEVGEHLRQPAAEQLVWTLMKLAPVVLFGAAIPYQPGTGHVNCQWPNWWAQKFAAQDYAPVDIIRPRFWDDERVRYFHAQNLILYVRRDLLDELGMAETPVARLVHPRLLERLMNRPPAWRRALARLA